ncbi:MAG: TetR/AcrR family transcriptional regulator [Actinomycetota bacterium]|nr:TetR/AcrR family transcriptional regulator [Actinomycetota bacterium]
MSRWEPNAPGRLQQAAFELYAERGYDQTTVAEIAMRAGLTERTFFRHFADKREVLFDGGDRFRATLVDAVEAAPPSATTLEAVTAGIEAVGSVFPALELVRLRQALILANPELRERELIKLASLAASLGEALRRRGVPDTAAELAAETGVTVLRIAFTRWIEDPAERPWEAHVREGMDELRWLTAQPALPLKPETTHSIRE